MGLISTLALGMSCGSPSEITVEVPAEARADSATAIPITARIAFRGLSVADNTEVRFQVSAGSFAIDQAMPEKTARTSGGQARIDYFPPNTPQDVTLTVSFTNANRETISTDHVIALTGLPPADAALISLGCEAHNVGVLVAGMPRIELACTAQARDKKGNALPGAEMIFAAEAGQLKDLGPQQDGTRKALYAIDPGSAPPADVEPNAIELEADGVLGQNLVRYEGGRAFNPRDGVATLVVAVRGAEAFTDSNGNGQYDDDEFFEDEPEPFIDVDDDGEFNPSVGDLFLAKFDANGNGVWDSANGHFDDNTLIARTAHVLWTGAPEIFIVGPTSFPPQEARNYSVFLRDQHGNPPAGFDASDRVELTVSNKPTKVSVNGLVQQPLSAELGMTFDKRGRFVDFVREPTTRYPVLRRFDIAVSDTRTADDVAAQGGVMFTLAGSVRYTPGPKGNNIQNRTVQLQPLQVQIQ